MNSKSRAFRHGYSDACVALNEASADENGNSCPSADPDELAEFLDQD